MAFNTEIEKLERRWLENPLGLTFAPLAEAYRKGGDSARALELLEIGLAQHPNYVPAHIVRGRCYLDTQSDGAAELAFARVTELDPENVIAFKSLAELAERAGRLDEAVARLESLLEIDRNNEEARGQLDRLRELGSAPPTPEPEQRRVSGGQKRVSGGWREFALEEEAAVLDPDARRAVADHTLEDIKLYDPAELTPGESTEYQIASDAETLRPSDEHLEDVVIGLGVPLEPVAGRPVEAASEPAPFVAKAHPPIVDVVPPPPPMPFEAPTLPPPPFEELVKAPVAEDASAPPVTDTPPLEAEVLPQPEPMPVSAWAPPPPPQSEPEPELEPAPEPEPEEEPARSEARAPEAEEEPEPEPVVSLEEPELVVTETMAEIFLRQGHRELAQAVYTQLLLRDPENRRIAAALADLETGVAPDGSEPMRRHAAAATGGRSVEQLFAALLSATRPSVAAPVHPPAFEPSRRPSGEPTRPAQDALRLSAVFGEEAAPSGPASAPPDNPPAEPSFDEFFPASEGSAGDLELPKGPPTDGSTTPAQVPEDLEQFNAWLRGLKR